MITVTFTQNLQRHIALPPTEVSAATVREALNKIFMQNPLARGYIVDEQGRLRTHMNIFIDGEPINDRDQLSDPVRDGAEIYVMQALSGG